MKRIFFKAQEVNNESKVSFLIFLKNRSADTLDLNQLNKIRGGNEGGDDGEEGSDLPLLR